MPGKNTIERARLVYELTMSNYEPGRQDRCKRWVYRHIVYQAYPISMATFFRYLAIAAQRSEQTNQDKQLKLFD